MNITRTAVVVLLGAAMAVADPPGADVSPRAGMPNATTPSPSIQVPPEAVTNPAKPDSHGFFYIYAGKGSPQNHFIPSGWMGDYGDLRIDDANRENSKNAPTSIKIAYSAKSSQGANWAGIYWQQPANNWGNVSGGYDLSHYKKLTFWARGAHGGEKIAEFKVGGITGDVGDTDSASIGPVTLTQDWKQYTIDLSGKSLVHIIGGFAWSASRTDNPQGFSIYLDNIRFES